MESIKYMRDSSLDSLRANIQANLFRYRSDASWMHEYFQDTKWFMEAKDTIAGISLEIPEKKTVHLDLENTQILYSALRHLPISHAADERLWAGLVHDQFWEYMRKRWPVEGQNKPVNFVRERYFFMPNRSRALVRNGLARLWWYGYLTYDETRDEPFSLTRLMLEKLDIAQTLLERSVSHAQCVVKGVLRALEEEEKEGSPFNDRDEFRDLLKYLNHLGAVTVLDTFTEDEVLSMCREKIVQIRSQRAAA